jgi:hypothetical protein
VGGFKEVESRVSNLSFCQPLQKLLAIFSNELRCQLYCLIVRVCQLRVLDAELVSGRWFDDSFCLLEFRITKKLLSQHGLIVLPLLVDLGFFRQRCAFLAFLHLF